MGSRETGTGATAAARTAYAETVAERAGIRSGELKRAFARVPREAFLGPRPWRILRPEPRRILRPERMGDGYETTSDADPRHLDANVLGAISDPRRGGWRPGRCLSLRAP